MCSVYVHRVVIIIIIVVVNALKCMCMINDMMPYTVIKGLPLIKSFFITQDRCKPAAIDSAVRHLERAIGNDTTSGLTHSTSIIPKFAISAAIHVIVIAQLTGIYVSINPWQLG